MRNLISNALKFSPPSSQVELGVTVSKRTAKSPLPKDILEAIEDDVEMLQMELRVKDLGPGISQVGGYCTKRTHCKSYLFLTNQSGESSKIIQRNHSVFSWEVTKWRWLGPRPVE